MAIPEHLHGLVTRLPEEPGIYIMKAASGVIIYVGKASNLKKRVSSYFQKKDHDVKTRVLVKNIHTIEFIVTDSEIEALLLESNVIKKEKPRFNIRLKDDKRYPYLAVTLDDEYPRVIYTRRVIKGKNRYFGPYTDSRAARKTMWMINTIFRLKTCNRPLPLKPSERPCLNYQMKRCSGICQGEITREEYLSLVDNAVGFLEGNVEPVVEGLTKRMEAYAAAMEYEKAGKIRDIIYAIQQTAVSQKVTMPIGGDRDYIAVSIQGREAILVLFEFRQGVLLGRKVSVFENAEYATPAEIIRSFLLEYYERSPVPDFIIASSAPGDRELLEAFLRERKGGKVSILTSLSKDDRGVIGMILKNIAILEAEQKADRDFKSREESLRELQEVLGLPEPPNVIVCFDISNFQGSDAVASMVFFRDGLPEKSGYRRFKIRGYDSPNDPAMIHEAVGRQVQHLVNEGLELPDLMVIDGGRTQLARAREAAANFDAIIPIISLAKRFEEIYVEPGKEPLRLPENAPALLVLKNLRDEAHRFAITYHRTLRDRKTRASALDDIPDVGEKTKLALLKHFGSVERIRNADVEELAGTPGIGKKTAQKVFRFFHQE